MHNTLSSEQADQLDTTKKIQTGFESAEFSDSENQEIPDEYFVHKNTEIWIPGHDKNIYKAKLLFSLDLSAIGRKTQAAYSYDR